MSRDPRMAGLESLESATDSIIELAARLQEYGDELVSVVVLTSNPKLLQPGKQATIRGPHGSILINIKARIPE